MKDLKKRWSHYVKGLKYREPTKEAANIYCQNFVIVLYIAKVNHYNPLSLQPSPSRGKKCTPIAFSTIFVNCTQFHHFSHELL